jgi:glucosamine-6-phosphate deaminase
MKVKVFRNRRECGVAAGCKAAALIQAACENRGFARVLFAAAPSQNEMLEELRNVRSVAWEKVLFLHMDEFLGVTADHRASFRRYLREHLEGVVDRVRQATWVVGETDDPEGECNRLNELLIGQTLDVTCCGIGENGHLAFNDPPCLIGDQVLPFHIVGLDLRCREQQVVDGLFDRVDRVPSKAISASVPLMVNSLGIVCTVVGPRKAEAVRDTIQHAVSPDIPASYLRTCKGDCTLFLDEEAAAQVGFAVGDTVEVTV